MAKVMPAAARPMASWRTAEKTGEAGGEDSRRREIGADHAHDEAEIRDQPVIGAEHGGTQRVAADAAVPPLDAGEDAAGHAARRAGDGLQDAGMRAFRLRQAGEDRLRLRIV